MSQFDKQAPPFRLAPTNRGDTLQSIAAREFGDANRWADLVWLNELRHPYITDNPALAGPGVLLTGDDIKVYAPAGFSDRSYADSNAAFAADCKLTARALSVDDAGDLLVVAGVKNLTQQLSHRISTPMGQATRHPEYGCKIYRVVGTVNNKTAAMLGGEYVKASLLADYRVKSVPSCEAVIRGDEVGVTASAEAVNGDLISIAQPQ